MALDFGLKNNLFAESKNYVNLYGTFSTGITTSGAVVFGPIGDSAVGTYNSEGIIINETGVIKNLTTSLSNTSNSISLIFGINLNGTNTNLKNKYELSGTGVILNQQNEVYINKGDIISMYYEILGPFSAGSVNYLKWNFQIYS